MRVNAFVAIAISCASLTLAGCISNEGTMRVAALGPTPAEIHGVDVRARPAAHRVVGRDTRVTSILLVPTFDGPVLERAAADALAKGGGDLLIGAHVRTIDHWFLIGWSVLEVRGDVVNLHGGGDAQ